MADLGSIATLKTTNDARLPDNAANEISEADVRNSFTDTADTVAGEILRKGFGIPMTYSNAVIGAPAEGVFRFDSVTAGSIANAFIHMTAPTGVDNAGLWSLNNPQRGYVQVTHSGGVLVMQFNGDGANNGGVYEAPMVHLSGPLPANGAACRVLYTPGPAASGTLVLPWRMWGTDENFGGPVMPATLADHYAATTLAVNFNPDADSGLLLFAQMPDSYEGQAINVRIAGDANVGSGGNVIFYANAVIINPGSTLVASADGVTLNTSTLNLTGTDDSDLYSKTIAVTPSGGGWSDGAVLAILIGREGTNILDTHDETVRFICATVTY